MRPTRDILAVGAICVLLSACVPPPDGYYAGGYYPGGYPSQGPPAYSPYGRGPAYQPYPLPPPVPPGAPMPQQPQYENGPAYRSYDPPPAYRPDDGRFGRGRAYGAPEGPGVQDWPSGGPESWDSGYGRAQVPSYRPDDGAPYGQPRRNRLDDPEPDSMPGERGDDRRYDRGDGPSAGPRPDEGSTGLGQPVWR